MKITQRHLDKFAGGFRRPLNFNDPGIMYLATLVIRIEAGALKSDVSTDGLRDVIREAIGE